MWKNRLDSSAAVPPSFAPSDDTPIGHVAFSFADLAPVLERIDSMGVEVVSEVAKDEAHGFESIFVRGPDELLVELVQADPR